MKHILTKNIGIKIASLLFAALMWVIVTNVNDPIDSRSFDNVPVRIVNDEILIAANKVYWVLEDTDIINRVTVRAPRSVISRINYSNIIATADIREISSLDTVAITLDVDNASRAEISDMFGSSNILKLEIEERRTRNIQIRPSIEGEIAEGYMMGDITISPNFIRISGPESLINSVSYAEFSFDITNITNEIRTNADVNLYNSESVRIPTERINQNINDVSIIIPMLETKMLPIRYSITGTPADGYRTNGDNEINKTQILVAGRSLAVRELSEIVIPGVLIDLTDRTETVSFEFNLNDFIPANIRLADLNENTLRISIGIEEEERRLITLRESQIRFVNAPDGFIFSLNDFDETPPITVVGLRRDLNLIQPLILTGEINITKWMEDRGINELSEGIYQIPVDVVLGQNISMDNQVLVSVNITSVAVY